MHPRVRDIMRGKRTLLLLELARELGYAGPELERELHGGFDVIGQLPSSGEFPEEVVPAVTDVGSLEGVAKWAQHAVRRHLRKNAKTTDAALGACLKEVEVDGTMTGPYTKQKVGGMFGRKWVPVPRLVIDQNGEYRFIDDTSIFLQNSTVARSFKLTLGGIDELVSLVRAWLAAAKPGGRVVVVMPDGSRREGKLHKDWSVKSA